MSNTVQAARCRIGIDVGGTFNDFVLADDATGQLTYFKEPSVSSDPSLAVERGIAGILSAAGVGPADVGLIIHGTTLGLNTIIQRRGARMALVTSQGNRDVFEIARARMPAAYDFTTSREVPLVPRDLVFEVGARQRSDGSVESPLTDRDLDDLAGKLRGADVGAVAVMLLNSYRHPGLERELAEGLRARLPGVLVTESAAISPEMREYERALLAGINAYIHPLMETYFQRLQDRMAKLGVTAPIFITANNGGTVSMATARQRPIDTILSGPAAGVVAALRVAPEKLRPRLLTLDMGGTSTDMAVVQDGEPEFTVAARVGDFPLILPVVSVTAIGAGGGSIIWLDEQGVLKIGPESAGADPGPACYGRGGQRAAVTDCYLATGILDPKNFLGGRMTLDRDASLAALDRVAVGLKYDGDDRAVRAGAAALLVATAKMAVELSKMLARRGVDPREFALVAYGGAGATHACLLAEEAKLGTVIVPPAPGTFCALGAILADVRRDYARSLNHLLAPKAPDYAPVATALQELEAEALAWLAGEGAGGGTPRLILSADMRYPAQAFEMAIAVPAAAQATLDGASLAELFHAEHERLYGFADRNLPVRVSTVRLSVVAPHAPVKITGATSTGVAGRISGTRAVFHDGKWEQASVYARPDVPAGTAVQGPALIEQSDTTIWVLPGWQAQADATGNLLLTRP
jgi:N-methylhydantoinase A